MILIKDLYVVRKLYSSEVWKDALFTESEADKEIELAEIETRDKYEKLRLDDYINDIYLSVY